MSEQQRKPAEIPPLLNLKEMMAILRVSRRTMDHYLSEGAIPGALRLRGEWRFHRPTVERWLEGKEN